MKHRVPWIVTTLLVSAAAAHAQPTPAPLPFVPTTAPVGTPPPPGSLSTAEPANPDGTPIDEPAITTPADPDPYAQATPPVTTRAPVAPRKLAMPEVLTTPTGWLLPAAVFYTKLGLDTGGGVAADSRIGLGDVAEFGIATTDGIRERTDDADPTPSRIQPYVTASFRLGIAERRLFDAQPGVTLGFRKSFERTHANYKSRMAELTLVASKHIGDRFAVHLGGAFWDASLEGVLDAGGAGESRIITLHGFDSPGKQLRPFGGIEVEPLPHSQILVDLGWAPELCYLCTGDPNKIKLKPVLSWGVRYEISGGTRFEAGVRVPDIGDANLLDAQIFGDITFTSWALHRRIERTNERTQ